MIVQGPINGRPSDAPALQVTRRVVASVRAVWPRSEILVSTWRGADPTGLDCDRVVYSDDPGAVSHNDTTLKNVFNNLNRQIVSTRAGLSAATRRFAVKLRSDCVLEHATDFTLLDRAPRQADWSLLEKPVITLNLYTRHPLRRPVLFHVSDLFHAGLLTDLRTLWSAPLVEEPAFTRTIDPRSRPSLNAYPEIEYLMRCAAEQYIGEYLARTKCPRLRLVHHSDGNTEKLFLWLRVLANNFIILTAAEAGVAPPARLLDHQASWDLFQPADRAWLLNWTRPHVPVITRFFAASSFYSRQAEFGRRSLAARIVRRIGRRLNRARQD